jgi:pentatricopeptide repeat protein
MTDSGYFELASQDVAVQLDLISKVHGIEQAQKLFNNTPQHLKVLKVYSALLNCYAKAKLVEKAESVVQEMKSLGFANTLLVYNVILNFYYQTGNPEKINSLMQEMEQNGIGCDKFAHSIQLSAYASVSEIVGIEKTLAKMESDPNVFLDWTSYTAAAKGYIKVGLVDKALEMLEKSERLVTGKRRGTAYDSLITLYAATGKTNEVLRIWELYKKNEKVYKEAYISIITSLLKLDDFENAEKIFEEWEFQNHSCYDIHIPNFLIDAYSRKGLVEKAETLIDRAISKGGEPNAKTWYHLATGYLQNGQTLKAVEAMKKAVVVSGRMWKPSNEILANCLGYLKVEGDLGKLTNFMDLLRDNDIISLDIQERLLNHIKNAKSSSDVLGALTNN